MRQYVKLMRQANEGLRPSGKTENSEKVFIFPKSRDGFETVKSRKELALILKKKFKQEYDNPGMQCTYEITEAKGKCSMQIEEHRLTASCKICTNTLVYAKNMFIENEYKLVKMSNYHVHGYDPHKIEQILRKTQKKSRVIYRQGRPYDIQPIHIESNGEHDITKNIQYFIRLLPTQLMNATRCKIVCRQFNISKRQYETIMRSIRADYSYMTLRELFANFEKKGYQYRYLPSNLFEINQQFVENRKKNEFLYSLQPYDPDRVKNVHAVDIVNPQLPNVILVISPQMKELFYKYGHYVGFDLTFSLIRQKPQHAKQYLVGVIAGTSQSRRILVFALVITNCQSTEVYKYIFRQFLTIMGKNPETVITDQESAIQYALTALKQQGIFTGVHLLDMFHILNKFRRSATPEVYQNFRKMMHSRDRIEYRRHYNNTIMMLQNDYDLQLLRAFDNNSERYCYTQVVPTFIGIGISDAINEKYHDLIKEQIPYESKYIKVVNIILDLIENRNNKNRFGNIQKSPIEEIINMPFMKQYRTVLSDKIFEFVLQQICKSLSYVILTQQQEVVVNHKRQKLEEGLRLPKHLHVKDKYKVKTKFAVFTVFNEYQGEIAINDRHSRRRGKWKCYCELEEKSGYLCSHIAKVLITIGEDFFGNIHPRWIIKQDGIEEDLKSFIFRERKFHHFTRVRMRKNPKFKKCRKYRRDDFDGQGKQNLRLYDEEDENYSQNNSFQSDKEDKSTTFNYDNYQEVISDVDMPEDMNYRDAALE